jgi:ribonucleoside-diphosphate reductase alpha chain
MGPAVVTSAPVVEEVKKPEAVAEDDFVQAAPVPLACSIDNPDCEACQ